MKIVILGPAHPYRGGLASIMETMPMVQVLRVLSKMTFKMALSKSMMPMEDL